MFPINVKEDMPVSQLVIRSVAVRGYLGPMSVWVSKPGLPRTEDYQYWGQEHWTCLYQKRHEPSRRTYQTMTFDDDNVILLTPGEERILYIHSAAPHDRSVVYDNSYFPGAVRRARYEDPFLQIRTGRAHLSPTVFGQTPIWGVGTAWRTNREFVGQLEYGIVYKLWQPERHANFGRNFQDATATMLACQRRHESPVARLPDECIFYILNMCRWDWFEDDAEEMADLRRRLSGSPGATASSSSSSSRRRRADGGGLFGRSRTARTKTNRRAATNANNQHDNEVAVRRRFWFGLGPLRHALALPPS